jgi:SSS family solute:Na+ symporter
VFMLGMVWAAVLAVLSAVGGPGAATAALREANPEFLALGGGLYSPQFVVGTAVYIAFGVTMFPQVNQRFFVADSETVFKRTFVLWPVLVLLLFVPAFMLGAWAAGLGVTVPEGSNVVPVVLGEYTPAWFTALVVAGALAAMMSSSDSMLLSGSSYLTRDVYRPVRAALGRAQSASREATVARVGVVAFATLSLLASLRTPGTLVEIGNTAFGGFAQLALPVAVALYWRETTRTGMVAGIAGSQLFYLANLGAVVAGVQPSMGAAGAAYYLGWHPGIPGMALGLVLTVGVSAVTSPAPGEDRDAYVAGSGAD